MKSIAKKTLQDLEFSTILEQISDLCTTEIGKEHALLMEPFANKEQLLQELNQTSEYVSSFSNQNAVPGHYFDPINYELKMVRIEDSFLEASGFKKIASLIKTTNELILFLKKFQEYYPFLYKTTTITEPNKIILQKIEVVLDKYGEVKDTASVDLKSIRQNIQIVRGKINQSFGVALQQYNSAGYLDDIKESVVENRRVLAVLAMHRKKIRGSVLGQSKTGSIVYIEPESTFRFSRELSNLEYEEREEIMRILKNLTNEIRPFYEELIVFQNLLAHIDIVSAKA